MARKPAPQGKIAAQIPAGQAYTAAVRFPDGSSELLRIKAARDVAEAVAIVQEHLLNTQVIMVSPRREA
ncbi:MAG: hypothetical protein L6Q40_01585 [Azonexus sp.]|nr:hypothetical protein [Azonexus sp.]